MSASQARETKDVSKGALTTSRGRVVPSRYLNGIASSRPTVVSSKPQVVTSTQTKASTSSSISTSNGIRKPTGPLSNDSIGSRSMPEPMLNIASQFYPWGFMRYTLQESSDTAEMTYQARLAARARELDIEEEALADDRLRYQLEKETLFIDGLSHERTCYMAPPLVRKFVQSQVDCQAAIVDAMRIAGTSHNLEDVRTTRMSLQKLDELIKESTILRVSLAELSKALVSDSFREPWKGLLLLLDARLESLSLSRELVARVRDNDRQTNHLYSLQLQREDRVQVNQPRT